ncbi:MAG: bifunctional diaminohydroxyphosphoribosylaminopyrimidine deaminase/5-amino-6-(5-phosphoribosylamino)uracil reductase RibD [Bacteroidota bacterium]|nr:bifunctional diaminohydroxyphosphoribosylaminopyrimidine deaminase/5-amino-6-(5-phosphoribosylamino)uracil reductase RibD [Bacteroidota bacterium]
MTQSTTKRPWRQAENSIDEHLMQHCLVLAAKGKHTVEPNPLVGCVIVRKGKVVGQGWHRKFGGPHAEQYALRSAGTAAKGATLYVNLEPCAHAGKTPPCTDAIIGAGIRRVVVGMIDPNPIVSGAGIEQLRSAGIECHVGVLEEECKRLNARFIINILKKRPYIVLKAAVSMDGYIASLNTKSQWVSGEHSRIAAHRLRAEMDAVLIGAETLRNDNPLLTVRHVAGRSPRRIILTSSFRLPMSARLFKDRAAETIILTSQKSLCACARKALAIERKGIRIIEIPSRDMRVPLSTAMNTLFNQGIYSLLVEGGANVYAQFISQGLVDRIEFFIAPKLFLKGVSAFPMMSSVSRNLIRTFRVDNVEKLGEDIHVVYTPILQEV